MAATDQTLDYRVKYGDHGMVGISLAMREVYDKIRALAHPDVFVLIKGENGSGKELVARALYEGSQRSGKPFIPVNCAAVPSELLESELFGHKKGAFTSAGQYERKGLFATAHGGILYLDEIGEMSPYLQAKLLRAAEYGEIRICGLKPSHDSGVDVCPPCAQSTSNKIA